jgi:ATP-dependent RNA helicase DeaD
VALFSATMAPQIKRIAQHHLRQPEEITIRGKTSTAANIRQRYWMVSGLHKLDALTRILEVETFDAMLVFARTKIATVEVADKLAARGFSAAALNGDMQQNERERMIAQLKSGQIDILVATDVAARGLDVERISHVVNFDVPYDTESYVHRIGRTGRAGRSGEAILFIAPRERNMLHLIERATRQPIELMHLPTVADVNAKRAGRFKQRITDLMTQGVPENYRQIVEEIVQQTGADLTDVAAALAVAAQGKTPLLLGEKRASADAEHARQAESPARGHERHHHDAGERPARAARGGRFGPQEHYRIEVGSKHGVQPGNIVGAIANEAGLSGQEINGLKIREDHSVVRLPAGMPAEVLQRLAKTRIRGRAMAISLIGGGPPEVHRKGGPGKKPPRR